MQTIWNFCKSVLKALFLDIPFLLDSAWRRVDFNSNTECIYGPTGSANATIERRSFWHKPVLILFALTVFFTSYGPTWDSLCSLWPQSVENWIRWIIAGAIAIAAIVLFGWLEWENHGRVAYRMAFVRPLYAAVEPWRFEVRRATVYLITGGVIALIVLGSGYALARYFYSAPDETAFCAVHGPDLHSWGRLFACVAAVALFAFVTEHRRLSIAHTIWLQAGIIAALSALQWYVLSPPDANEASDLPYRHLFTVVVLALCLVICLAPFVARLAFKQSPAALDDMQAKLRAMLADTELFVRRDEPSLDGRRLVNALIYGPFYHPLHVMLIPSLVALLVYPDQLYVATLGALLASALLVAWGNISSRWQMMTADIERWFLSGTPLFVSLFVMIAAVLRLMKFDYVSTILDAAPFGVVFALVLMSYVLSWLLEYWLNRVVGVQLLALLGVVENEAYVPYHLNAGFDAVEGVAVQRERRYVANQGNGRYVAIGTGTNGGTAFHFYFLDELLDALVERRAHQNRTADHNVVQDLIRRIFIYFFTLNFMIYAVIGGFVLALLYTVFVKADVAEPVLTANAEAQQQRLVDLGGLLQRQADAKRQAIIIVGSGGGTRAALYTASVLKGLHRLGADKEIVLASGVSGGGVALAYFAGNYDVLTGTTQPSAAKPNCPFKDPPPRTTEEEWACFERSLALPFIQDVLNGATEWRIFVRSPLSVLLAETFDRNLFPRKTTFGAVDKLGLILNSTVVGHPDAESVLLRKTLDSPRSPDPLCEDSERPYNLIQGGRLIFTNLREAGAFPGGQSRIPDTRLPYQVVQDADVKLAYAAALNANFPPVFPNARVRLKKSEESACTHRSYYVTDGGAQENLGLVSALYALKNAIEQYPQNKALPTIRFVIAEASAATYDYTQDRGLSAATGGSRERMTGGVVDMLVSEIERLTKARNNPQEAQRPEFYYLALPLVFRARGGIGTNWMYARTFDFHDPNARGYGWFKSADLPSAAVTTANIDRITLRQLWDALHEDVIREPHKEFCQNSSFKGGDVKTVQRWICGAPNDPRGPRDLHVEEWRRLVKDVRSNP